MLLLGSDFTLRPSWLQAYVSATTWQCTRFPSFCPLRWSSQTSSMARPQGFQPMVSGGDKANVVLDSLAPPTLPHLPRLSCHSAYTHVKICTAYWDKAEPELYRDHQAANWGLYQLGD